ncbi:acetyl/propionyl/methylcrotonyl-CoA carboxylase subunit alpha [Nocardioides sp.]|uniref:acetyl/propionyl/methylcrotonyl-CoA carboxylase subunit alpha n=1 Tax=Nocardioides sp. TaxID=35761 RepID=UPI002C8A0C3F|nr:biotin carboxylase N-terminal domain-containing protein [Nocardioides sp.]HXH79073.1 biotin carboxylase N-terminal domain-containing protein [Nocardioides sp.]
MRAGAGINRLLVANRGEIARRVFATCRRLGIETVAVHSDADAELPFVAEADVAVRLDGNAPSETYLRGDLIIEAARRTGADAIHPGYGFLSENAEFARAVEKAGLIWVGPTPESIEAMGSKIEAKRLMKAAGVPILEAPASPTDSDFPVLIKASAGGGGRGMRIVRRAEDLEAELATARAEAASAFGDGTVFVEPYVERSRHIEVQLVGTSVYGDRDCSVQRRHQKVVEEAPAPGLRDEVRAALHEAAHQAAAAVDYRGAGTVEFLYDPDTERFFFLEMNTRLQVEHPVTELVHHVDLVELQLIAAESDWTMVWPDPVDGHAIEVRLYAEDATWTPQSGRLVTLDIPADAEFGPLARAGIRVDSGFLGGNEVSTHYDAMLAKVISWAPTRSQAIRQLVTALRRARIHGVVTNRDHLVAILAAEEFAAADVTTSWLEGTELATATPDVRLAAVVAAIAGAEDTAARRTVQRGIPVAWRNVVSQPQSTTFIHDNEPVEVQWFGARHGYVVDGLAVLAASPDEVVVEVAGVRRSARVTRDGTQVFVDLPGSSITLTEVPRFTDPADAIASGSLIAPMPGTVVTVAVTEGDDIEAGAVVLVLEAMKMQHTITAPTAGRVAHFNVQSGQQVAAGDVLAVVEGEEA